MSEPDEAKITQAGERKTDLIQEKKADDSDKKSIRLPRILVPGQKMVIDEHEEVLNALPAELKRINARRAGKLNFEDGILNDVVKEVNRYLTDKLVIGDSRLKNHRISLHFNITDSAYFLSTLEKTLPIRTETLATGEILLLNKEQI